KVLNDHPEIFYFTHENSYYWSNGRLEFKYKYPKDQIESMVTVLNQKIASILGSAIKSNMCELEKELALHNYLVLNTAYDYENLKNNTIPELSYEAYGCLIDGIAVCDGYAKAMKLLLNQVGIEALRVIGEGKGESHAWNLVKIDGFWYHLDVTWDDPVPDVPNRVRYTYFNLPDSVMEKDHTWTASDYPQADQSTYLYFQEMAEAVFDNGYFFYRNEADYNKLYKISLKGTGKTKLSEDVPYYLIVDGDWIYYSNYSWGGYLFKIKTDGTERSALNEVHSVELSLVDGWLTYKDHDRGTVDRIFVGSSTVPVTEVILDQTQITLRSGSAGRLFATVVPANATNQNVFWESSNPAVVTVVNGQIEAVGPGNAEITVITENGQRTANCSVVVYPSAQKSEPLNLKLWEPKTVYPAKTWRITFNQEVNQTSLTEENIYVTDEEDYTFPVRFIASGQILEVEPLYAYPMEKTFYLNVTSGVKSITKQALKQGVRLPFTISNRLAS
ncbi:MAG: DUF5050 domain-containing protein, partial [Syntrophomonadaceae bacterium]|nr:DUF5050 domain-containing protein [Syntrophomonadaceae bacterium]